jgi:hypothetical protein
LPTNHCSGQAAEFVEWVMLPPQAQEHYDFASLMILD